MKIAVYFNTGEKREFSGVTNFYDVGGSFSFDYVDMKSETIMHAKFVGNFGYTMPREAMGIRGRGDK